jgi:hypothetical protein
MDRTTPAIAAPLEARGRRTLLEDMAYADGGPIAVKKLPPSRWISPKSGAAHSVARHPPGNSVIAKTRRAFRRAMSRLDSKG